MRFLQLFLEVLSRVALLFFIALIGLVLATFLLTLFLPTVSKYLTIISVGVTLFVVFALIYALFVRLDDNEKLWDYIPNILSKGVK